MIDRIELYGGPFDGERVKIHSTDHMFIIPCPNTKSDVAFYTYLRHPNLPKILYYAGVRMAEQYEMDDEDFCDSVA